MKRKGIGSGHLMVVVFGVVIIIILSVASSHAFAPLVRFGPFSPCWGGFVSSFNIMTGMELLRSPQKINVGECVDSVHFVNRESVSKVAEELGYWWIDCEPGHPSYVIGIPWANQNDKSWLNPFDWDDKLWEKAKGMWQKEFGGIKPVCKALDKPFRKEKHIKGPGLSASASYCMGLKKDGDYYVVGIKNMAVDEKCTYEMLFGEKKSLI